MIDNNSHTIEGYGQQTHTRTHSEDLIDYFVVRLDPTREAKVTECGEDKVREPVPTERHAACHSEEGIAGHLPSIITASCQTHSTIVGNLGSLTAIALVPD
jgi:hypothetical protein